MSLITARAVSMAAAGKMVSTFLGHKTVDKSGFFLGKFWDDAIPKKFALA